MEKKWWHGKTSYQIYPKSFCDSNGDGIGDLRGIIGKLPYLQQLGIGILWISPVYRSPMADQGYDISDYYEIDPVFGTMADMEELLAEARKRDIAVVMDLVVNHCSDEHQWFRRACEDPEGEYGQRFYIQDRKPDGSVPCNWRSYFGGSVWEPLPGHPDKVYLHMFHKKQPDLNWENPKVRREIYKMINWWLDKGRAGFRIDAIINIKKPLPFRDYPADRSDGLCSPGKMLEDARGVEDFLEELADATFRRYDAFTVGEVFHNKPEALAAFIGEKGFFSTMFDFGQDHIDKAPEGWYLRKPATGEQYKNSCFESQKQVENVGFLANIIENHDQPRGCCRYLPVQTERAKKMLGGLNFLLRGLPFIFQGQELGMENMEYRDPGQIDDVYALGEYRTALAAGLTPEAALAAVGRYSRDNARTPMQWDDSPGAGFTTGTPWLPVNPNYKRINCREQLGREDSVLNFYKRLIALRSSGTYGPTLVYGTTEPYLREEEGLMAYYRRGERTLLVLGSFRQEPRRVPLPGEGAEVLLSNVDGCRTEKGEILLEGWQLAVLEIL